MTIANLDQLDGSGLDGLYLVHARLRASSDPKLSLQALAESIQAKLNKELLVKFEGKLVRAGWFKATQQQRDGARFRFVERKVYRVVDGFPRILRPDLRQFGPGVDVKKYTLDLNACSKFVLEPADEKELWQRLRTDDPSSVGTGIGAVS